MKAILYSKEGKKKQEVVLNPEVFAARVNHRLLELVKNAYAANLRHGTHQTKTRKEVSGGGKKPWKQKGTGRARHGSTRSPIWRHGGTVFGPHPRSYYVNLPQNMKKTALISALSLRGEEKAVLLLEDVQMETSKTKEWVEIFKKLPLDGKRALCVVQKMDEKVIRASKNFENQVRVVESSQVNAYDILNRPKLVLVEEAVAVIEKRVLGEANSAVQDGSQDEEGSQAEKGTTQKNPAQKSAAKSKKSKKST